MIVIYEKLPVILFVWNNTTQLVAAIFMKFNYLVESQRKIHLCLKRSQKI